MSKRKYSKQILRYGEWNHPNGPLKIDENFATKIVENFKRTPFSPVVRGHNPDKIINENPNLIISKNITNIEKKNDGVYVEFEADSDDVDKYEDVSASIQPDYVDHESGKMLGPVLKHVAFVVNPFIKNLKPFAELADGDEQDDYLILLSDINMSKKELKTADLEDATKVDEVVTTPEDEKKEEVTVEPEDEKKEEVTEKVEEKVETPTEEVEKKEEVSTEATQLAELKEQLAQKEVELAEAKKTASNMEAENFFNTLLNSGKATPTMKAEIVELASIDEKTIDLGEGNTIKSVLKSLFDKLPKIVNLEEQGVELEKDPVGNTELSEFADKDINALRDLYKLDHPNMKEEEFKAHLVAHKDILKKNLK